MIPALMLLILSRQASGEGPVRAPAQRAPIAAARRAPPALRPGR